METRFNRGRAVTADHVLFAEAIEAFRHQNNQSIDASNELPRATNYLLLSFELVRPIETMLFRIGPTVRARLDGAYGSITAPIVHPTVDVRHNSHLVAIALGAVLTFIAQRPVTAPRDGYMSNVDLDERNLHILSLQYPIVMAGPGAHDSMLSGKTLESIERGLLTIEKILYGIDYKNYLSMFQAIRLVHLAHLTKREDFALAYSLLIAAIESVAQIAIKRDKVKENNKDKEAQWEKQAEDNILVQELLSSYKEARGKNQYLSERFVKFILDYCPVNSWDRLPHPYDNLSQRLEESGGGGLDHLTEKSYWEKYPSDLTEKEIKTMLSDAYKHRSVFIHTGGAPPHKYPQASTRFFEVIDNLSYDENSHQYEHQEIVVPNFDLISFIAKESIMNFFEKKIIKQ